MMSMPSLIQLANEPLWDTHFHILEAAAPVVSTAVLPNQDASVESHLDTVRAYGITHGLVVQPSMYGTDNTVLLKALKALGRNYRATCVIDRPVDRKTLSEWHEAGIRGVRFNQIQFGATQMDDMADIAAQIADFGWHIELHLQADKLPDHWSLLKNLPTRLVLDHLGRCSPNVPDALNHLLRLFEHDHVWIKVSGPYHEDGDDREYEHSLRIARRLISANPDRLVWGSDWPHVTEQIKPPYSDMVQFLESAAGNQETLLKLISKGPSRLFS